MDLAAKKTGGVAAGTELPPCSADPAIEVNGSPEMGSGPSFAVASGGGGSELAGGTSPGDASSALGADEVEVATTMTQLTLSGEGATELREVDTDALLDDMGLAPPIPGQEPPSGTTLAVKQEMLEQVPTTTTTDPPGPPVTIDMTGDEDGTGAMEVDDGELDGEGTEGKDHPRAGAPEGKGGADDAGPEAATQSPRIRAADTSVGAPEETPATNDDPMTGGVPAPGGDSDRDGSSDGEAKETAAPKKSKAKSKKAKPAAQPKAAGKRTTTAKPATPPQSAAAREIPKKTRRIAPIPVAPRSKRPQRPAAQHAQELLLTQALQEAEDDAEERQQQKRAREVIELDGDEDEEEFDDEPTSVVADVKYLVARRLDPDATADEEPQRQYLAVWDNVGKDEEKTRWLNLDDMITGLDRWVEFVDVMYDRLGAKDGEMPDFHTYLSKSTHGMKMVWGASTEFTCVYDAVAKLLELTEAGFTVTKTMIKGFETSRRLERLKREGLSFAMVNEFIGLCGKHGWKYQVSKNLYDGLLPAKEAIAMIIEPEKLYLVGTCDRVKRGHCVVVETTPGKFGYSDAFIHEDGSRINLGEYDKPLYDLVFVREILRRDAVRDQDLTSGQDAPAEVLRPVVVGTARKRRRGGKKNKKQRRE